MSQALITQLLAQREAWLELEPGKRVKLRRPAELEMSGLRLGINLQHMKQVVVGWEGITEADLLGPTVGASSPVEFTPELWEVVVADRAAWFTKVADETQRLVVEHLKAKADAAKN